MCLSIQPMLNPLNVSITELCNQLKDNGQSEFDFVLAESGSSKNERLFHDPYRLRRLTTFVFCIADINNQSLIGRA